MKNHTSALILLCLILATTWSLSLHPHLSSNTANEAVHDVAKVDHDHSIQYILYRNTLDMMKGHVVITPPSLLPTYQLPVTSFSSAECGQMSLAERQQLQLELILVKSRLDTFSAALNPLYADKNIYKIKKDLNNQQALTNAMDEVLSSNCTAKVDLQQVVYQSNLLAKKKWITGNMTAVVKDYTNRSLTTPFVANCPKLTPFYSPEKGCFACKAKEYFNYDTKSCVSCTNFDLQTKSCLSNSTSVPNKVGDNTPTANNTSVKNETGIPTNNTPSTNNTGNATNPPGKIGTTPSNATNSANTTNATHPANTTNGTHPENANNATTPANATHPDKVTNATTPSNATHPANATNATTPANATNATTPANATHPNNVTNATTPSNATHPANATNATTPSNATHPANATNATTPSNATHPANATNATTPSNATHPANATNGTIPSNATTPANATHPNNAINGTTPANANATNSSNAKVENSTKPAPVLPPNSSNFNISNRILLSSSASLPKQSSSDVPCPESAPFYNGSVCIQCNAPHNLFDFAKKQCTSCPDQFSFNTQTNTCDKVNNDFLTAKTSANLINAGMPTNYWNLINDNIKAKNASVKDCPIATPYYDSKLKKCISCTAPTQYFNLDTRECQGCASPFVYDAVQRDCIDTSQSSHPVSGDALKMSGTLFAHQAELLQLLHGDSLNARHLFSPRHQ